MTHNTTNPDLSKVHSINTYGDLVFKYRDSAEVEIKGVKNCHGYMVLFSNNDT